MLGKSIRNGCNNLYLNKNLFKSTLKPNSYLTSILCQGLVNPSILTFSNINLKKIVRNLCVVSNVTEKSCNSLYLLLKVLHKSSKSNSYLMSTSRCGPVNNLYPNFWQYQSDRNIDKLIFYLNIQSKNTEIISISTLNPLRLGSHCVFNWVLSEFQTSV